MFDVHLGRPRAKLRAVSEEVPLEVFLGAGSFGITLTRKTRPSS
jgi:hypothetical protein